MKLVALAIAASLLSGCATSALVCTQSNRDDLERRNAELIVEKAELDRYIAGEPIWIERKTRYTHNQLVFEYTQSYNTAFDEFKHRADKFNKTCVKGKNGII